MYEKSVTATENSFLSDVRRLREEWQQAKRTKTQNKLAEFMSADATDSQYGILPEGYGGISYFIMFLFVPEFIGQLFIFFYVASGNSDTFSSMQIDYLYTWVVGYEIVAGLTLLLIFKKTVSFILS